MSAPTCPRPIYGRQVCGGVLEPLIVFAGLRSRCPKCERTAQRICRDCPARVEGKALWCPTCKRHRAVDSDRRHVANPVNRRRKYARWRKYSKRPKVRARRRVTQRAWEARNRDKKRAQKRRYHLKRTPAYVANYTRNNARPERAAAKRAAATAQYYADHPIRPDARCKGCSADTGWRGLLNGRSGAPPKWGYCCAPTAEVFRRIKRGFALWEAQRAGRRGAA